MRHRYELVGDWILPQKLRLERALRKNGVSLDHVRSRDRARHADRSLLGSSAVGVVDFSVWGAANPFAIGLYYTSVTLGNPSRELYVQINTDSDILWVACNPCNDGQHPAGALQPFKMGKCCVLLLVLQTPLSVTLSSMMMGVAFLGVTPRVFSHCLKGSDNGRSILVLGEIIEPGIVYTPLVPSHIKHTRNHHRLSTTLAYLAEQAYDHFGNAIIAPFSPSVHLIPRKGNKRFITTGR
ncbi:hypothetical protein ZIOFF_061793 [Zingiber officinale]|uniref:Peptidase A1 domain-containing protein n=1 Tax=Zingiber officinale TaxID=94328 RepID=A0A8J5F367_ZINOF|nr:hypothetical protein ZIOFF_061793 [Zingiber officinale]